MNLVISEHQGLIPINKTIDFLKTHIKIGSKKIDTFSTLFEENNNPSADYEPNMYAQSIIISGSILKQHNFYASYWDWLLTS